MVVGVQTQHRRGTAAQWSASGKILAAGELGATTDTKILKVGDGVNTWDELPIAFESLYLTIGGTATNSGLLGGISSDGFVKIGDATTAATADKVAKRDGNGRLKAAAGASTDDVTNFAQLTSAILDARKETVSRDVSENFTLAIADAGKMIRVNGATFSTSYTATIPADSTVNIPVGSWVDICAPGKGYAVITPAGGVAYSGLTVCYGYGSLFRLIKTDANAWHCVPLYISPGPLLRRKIKAGADNTVTAVGEFQKLRLDGADSGTALFTNNADTLGANEQYSSASDLYKCYARRSGWYDVTSQISLTSTGGGRMYSQIRVNNILQHASAGFSRNSAKNSAVESIRLPLNVNDYIEVYCKQDGVTSDTICDDDTAASFVEWAWRRPL